MADTKRDKLRQHSSATPSSITALMQRMAAGVNTDANELTALEWLRRTPNSLTIDTELTEDEWFGLIQGIERIKKRYQWYLGDAMVYGIRREYGATAEQIDRLVDITGKDEKTLHDYYKTALLFEISERSDILEFEQHRVIQRAFSEDTAEHHAERLRWLHIAETQRLSGRKLNTEIAASKLPAPASNGDNTAIVPAVETEPTPPPVKEPVIVVLNSPLKNREHRERALSIFKKVEKDLPLTDEDIGDVWMMRKYYDMLIERHQKQK